MPSSMPTTPVCVERGGSGLPFEMKALPRIADGIFSEPRPERERERERVNRRREPIGPTADGRWL